MTTLVNCCVTDVIALADTYTPPRCPITCVTAFEPIASIPSLIRTGMEILKYSEIKDLVFIKKCLILKPIFRSTNSRYPQITTASKSLAIAANANEKIIAITKGIKDTACLIKEIGNECEAQNSEVAQINSGIIQMDNVIQQNASVI